MRTTVLAVVSAFACFLPAYADEPAALSSADHACDVYAELVRSLPTEGQRARSARLELDFWYAHYRSLGRPAVRLPVLTKDRKAGELVLLEVPLWNMPDPNFSMAFLLVGKRVVDWACCWSNGRTAMQEVLLEDVDGDGCIDLAFRAKAGWRGLDDTRCQTRPGDTRVWLYAYAITSTGFRSLLPEKEQTFQLNISCDPAGQPVRLRVEGLPGSLREYRMCECTVSATNTSTKDLPMGPGKWFAAEPRGAGSFMTYSILGKRTVLKPGQTVAQKVRLYLHNVGDDGQASLRWTFVPGR